MERVHLAPVLHQIQKLVGARSANDAADNELLYRFASRQDEAAFEALVQRHGPMVLGVCKRVLHDLHDAEDAFQATFLVLARKARAIRKQQSVGSWLHGVAHRIGLKARCKVAKRHVRETRTEVQQQTVVLPDAEPGESHSIQEGPAEKGPGHGGPLSGVIRREIRTILDEELQRLPEKYRAPLVLCYLEGKTNEEVAQQLRWPVGSVKGRLNRARSLLQGRLARRGLAPSAGVMLPALGQNTVPSVLVRATVEGAVQFAFAGGAGIGSTPATALAEGTLKAMFMKKVKTAALGLAALAILASGIIQLHQLYAAPVPASLEPWFEEVPVVQVVPQPQPHLQEQPAPKVVEEPTPLTVLVGGIRELQMSTKKPIRSLKSDLDLVAVVSRLNETTVRLGGVTTGATRVVLIDTDGTQETFAVSVRDTKVMLTIGSTIRFQMTSKKPIKEVITDRTDSIRIDPVPGDQTTILITGLAPGRTRLTLIDADGHKEVLDTGKPPPANQK